MKPASARARGEGTPREPEQEDSVAGLVVLQEEGIRLPDVGRQTDSEVAANLLVEIASGPDALVVVDELVVILDSFAGQPVDVGLAIQVVPSAVTADDEGLGHGVSAACR